jgi:hypothetical protein
MGSRVGFVKGLPHGAAFAGTGLLAAGAEGAAASSGSALRAPDLSGANHHRRENADRSNERGSHEATHVPPPLAGVRCLLATVTLYGG